MFHQKNEMDCKRKLMWPLICKVLLFKFIFGSKQFYKQTVLKTTEIDYINWKLDLNFKILKDQKSITISEIECFKKIRF